MDVKLERKTNATGLLASRSNTQMQPSNFLGLQNKYQRFGTQTNQKIQGLANRNVGTVRAVQLQSLADRYVNQKQTTQQVKNNTGLPNSLKTGMEGLSGYSMDDVRVHRNSSKPAHLQAHAFAQGSDIHLGPGQEKHLPHEAWHVVQQKQGRVRPTMQTNGVGINDDVRLEKEADRMGAKAQG